jgi:hypothetical protein
VGTDRPIGPIENYVLAESDERRDLDCGHDCGHDLDHDCGRDLDYDCGRDLDHDCGRRDSDHCHCLEPFGLQLSLSLRW